MKQRKRYEPKNCLYSSTSSFENNEIEFYQDINIERRQSKKKCCYISGTIRFWDEI